MKGGGKHIGVVSGLIVYSTVIMAILPDYNSQRNYSLLLLFCHGILATQF
jgi:hypothetical protein